VTSIPIPYKIKNRKFNVVLQGIVEGLTSRTVVSASAPWRESLLLASFVVPRGIWRPAFRRLGASVTLLARNPVALDSVKAMLTSGENQHHHVLVADFNRPDSLKAVLDGYLAQTSPIELKGYKFFYLEIPKWQSHQGLYLSSPNR
jgi:hypothetical protein